MASSALNDIKVLDFSSWVVGPLVTKTMADYGATVILVETMKRPSNQRASLPFKDGKPGINRGGSFAYINPNKLSCSIDLRHPRGKELAERLVGWADAVVENFTPGVMERLGLGYPELVKINPDIIMLRLSAQGQSGPLSRNKALGLQLNGLAGFTHFTGFPDREPLSFMFAYSDYIVPFLGTAALCSALDYRKKTGKGQMLDMSQYESSLQFMAPYLLECSANGQESGRTGNSDPYASPHGYYACRGEDSWCSIAVFDDAEWVRFCEALGNPVWTQRDDFATILGRKQHETELDGFVGEWTTGRTAEEAVEVMQKAGIAGGVVKKASEIYDDPQLNERGFFWKMKHSEMDEFTHMGQPSVLSGTPARPKSPAPCLGEHTEFVCTEILKMTDDEFVDLLLSGALGL
ncbi:CaiB/BaiF CoA transferase family protein [Thermodesulfobacteriota bacterium]